MTSLITSSTQVVSVPPRISPDIFEQVLIAAGSPAQGAALEGYASIVGTGVCPAFILAIFKQESNFATDPASMVVKYKTNNPGNCRSSSIGPRPVKLTERGQFVVYSDWVEGFLDAANRLVDKDFPYYKEDRKTIAQVVERWAPSEDGNDTQKYINNLVQFMSEWIGQEEEQNMPDIWPSAADLGLPADMVRTHVAADIGPARSLDSICWDIVHDTQGNFAGDEQVLTANDSNVASCHALIAPDGLVVLMVPLNKTAWTPGNDYYAQRSINLEISGWDYIGYTDAQYRSYAAYHRWAVKMGCPIANAYIGRKGLGSGIMAHADVPNPFVKGAFGGRSGHQDPGPLFKWDLLVKYISGGDVVTFDPNPKKFNVGAGMLDYARQHQLTALTNEQYFIPDSNQPGLGKMSRAWVQDSKGVTYVLMASERPELAKGNDPAPWKVECFELV